MNDPIMWPILVYTGIVVLIVGFMIGFSYVLGQRHKERETGDPYESGIRITGSAHLRFPVHFYIVAMFFLIFDLEVIFIVAWAIAFRQLGWTGYLGILVFIGILLLVLIYEWRIGALDYATSGKKIAKIYPSLNQKKTES